MAVTQDINAWVKLAEQSGWRVEHTHQNRIKWLPPEGAPVLTPNPRGKTANSRTLRRMQAQLKRAGLFNQGTTAEAALQLPTLTTRAAGEEDTTVTAPVGLKALHNQRYSPEEDADIISLLGLEYFKAKQAGEKLPLDFYYGAAARVGREAESVRSRMDYLYKQGTLERRLRRQKPAVAEPAPAAAQPAQTLTMDDVAPALATLESMVFELAQSHAELKRQVTEELDVVTRGMQASLAELRGKVAKLSPTESTEYVTQDQLARAVQALDRRLSDIQKAADPLAKFRQALK